MICNIFKYLSDFKYLLINLKYVIKNIVITIIYFSIKNMRYIIYLYFNLLLIYINLSKI